MASLSALFEMPVESRTTVIVTTTIATTLTLFYLARAALYPKRQKTIPSPLKTVIPRLRNDEVKALLYPLDALPGGRDVPTPVSFSLLINRLAVVCVWFAYKSTITRRFIYSY
jgi:hypothetical protein